MSKCSFCQEPFDEEDYSIPILHLSTKNDPNGDGPPMLSLHATCISAVIKGLHFGLKIVQN